MLAPKRSVRRLSLFLNESIDEHQASTSRLVDHNETLAEEPDTFTDADVRFLKNTIMFKHSTAERLSSLFKEKSLSVKKNSYKQILAKGPECHNNIYILKSGEIYVWIKVTRENVHDYNSQLEKYRVYGKLDYSDIQKQKARYRRDALIELVSNKNSLPGDRPSFINSSSDFRLHNNNDFSTTSVTKFNGLNSAQSSHVNLASYRSMNPSRLTNFYSLKSATAPLRSMTAHVKQGAGIDLKSPSKLRFSASAHVKQVEIKNDHTHLKDNFAKNFEMTFKAVRKMNSAKTEYSARNSLNDEVELTEETNDDFKYAESITSLSRLKEPKKNIVNQANQANGNNNNNKENNLTASSRGKSYYIKLMKLTPGGIFGLSEMVHSESVNLENFKVSRYTNKEKLDSDKKEESNEENLYKNNQNSYVLICSTRQVEYYVIDRSAYLSQLHDGDTYKFQSHIDNLRKECIQIPSNQTLSGYFNEKSSWNNYKRNIYSDLLKSAALKTKLVNTRPKTAANGFESARTNRITLNSAKPNSNAFKKSFLS